MFIKCFLCFHSSRPFKSSYHLKLTAIKEKKIAFPFLFLHYLLAYLISMERGYQFNYVCCLFGCCNISFEFYVPNGFGFFSTQFLSINLFSESVTRYFFSVVSVRHLTALSDSFFILTHNTALPLTSQNALTP